MNEGGVGQIRADPQPECLLCRASGRSLYSMLEDRLFGAPGKWDLVRCENTNCGLVWLNPMPKAKDIGLAYNSYYTHSDRSKQNNAGSAANKSLLWSRLSRVTGLEARKRRSSLLYLDDRTPGKLLEIGCGDGRRLNAFRLSGWDVVGQETDPRAAERVWESHGIKVLVGSIEVQGIVEESFDAIIMNHVLEHVHDPLGLMHECIRLLKPGGVISIVTPNNQSLGNGIFKRDWRGLEPPRHLYLYSISALKKLALQAGFHDCSVATTAINAAGTVTQESLKLRKLSRTGSNHISPMMLKGFSRLFKILELCLLLLKKNAGEECILLATKENDRDR